VGGWMRMWVDVGEQRAETTEPSTSCQRVRSLRVVVGVYRVFGTLRTSRIFSANHCSHDTSTQERERGREGERERVCVCV
jgi:hypothetical protein